MCSTASEFAGLTVALMADLLQLPSVMGKPVYAIADGCDSLERHLSLNLWRMFQFAELTGDLLNKIRVGNVDEDIQKQIRERFIEESDTNYKENAWHMLAENYLTVKHNRKMLNKLPGKIYIINATDQIHADYKYPQTLISLAQNRKYSKTGGLAKCLELKVGANVVVTVNVDIQDMLINGQVGEVVGFEIKNSIVKKFIPSFKIL